MRRPYRSLGLREGYIVEAAISATNISKCFTERPIPGDIALGQAHWAVSWLLGKGGGSGNLKWALRDVTFEVRSGQMVGLVGPNGAGKTTLLKTLAGILTPTTGSIKIHAPCESGNPVTLIGTSGWMGMEWGFSVRQNLILYGQLKGLPTRVAVKRADDAMEVLRLGELRDRRLRTLSSGERQKTVLAKVFLVRTPVVLLDEPTTTLDPCAANDFRQLVREILLENGQTVMIASHRPYEIEQLCDHTLVLEHGRLVREHRIHDPGQKDTVTLTLRIRYPDQLRNLQTNPLVNAICQAVQVGKDGLRVETGRGNVAELVTALADLLGNELVEISIEYHSLMEMMMERWGDAETNHG